MKSKKKTLMKAKVIMIKKFDPHVMHCILLFDDDRMFSQSICKKIFSFKLVTKKKTFNLCRSPGEKPLKAGTNLASCHRSVDKILKTIDKLLTVCFLKSCEYVTRIGKKCTDI